MGFPLPPEGGRGDTRQNNVSKIPSKLPLPAGCKPVGSTVLSRQITVLHSRYEPENGNVICGPPAGRCER